MVKTEIIRLIQEISQRVNDFPRQHRLIQNSAHWSRLVSAMDTIEDAEESIDYYLNNLRFDRNLWGSYILALYGFLQSLEIEQDATAALFAALESESQVRFNAHEHEALREIRDIRHDVVGHPTNRKRMLSGTEREFHFYYQLLRKNMSKDEIKYGELDENGKRKWRTVQIVLLCRHQASIIVNEMKKLVKGLDETEMKYKAKFKKIRLAAFLEDEMYPWIPQLMMATCDPAQDNERRQGIQVITRMKEKINSLEKPLSQRELSIEGFNEYRNEIFHACDKLLEMFSSENCEHVNPLDSQIYGFFIKSKYKEFQDWAAELDRYYSSPSIPTP